MKNIRLEQIPLFPPVFLALSLLVGIGLRLVVVFQNRSFWWDESINFSASQLPVLRLLQGDYFLFYTHPWFYLLLLKWLSFFSLNETWLRSISLVPSLAVMVLMYLFAKRLTGSKLVGCLASFFYSASAYHVYYSSFVKVIEISLLFNLLTLYFALGYIKLGRRGQLYFFCTSLLLAIITSYYWVWPALLLVFLVFVLYTFEKVDPQLLKRLALGGVVIILLYLPWLIKLLLNAGRTAEMQQSAYLLKFSDVVSLYAGFTAFAKIPPVFLIILFLVIFLTIYKTGALTVSWKLILLFWLFSPPLLAYVAIRFMFLFGHGYKFNFSPWYASFSSLPLYLTLALALKKRGWLVVTCSLFFYLFINLTSYRDFLLTPTENWRGATTYLFLEQKMDNNGVVLVDDETHLRYYITYSFHDLVAPKIIALNNTDLVNPGAGGVFNQVKESVEQYGKSCLVTNFVREDDIPQELLTLLVPPSYQENPYAFCFQKTIK